MPIYNTATEGAAKTVRVMKLVFVSPKYPPTVEAAVTSVTVPTMGQIWPRGNK